VGGNVGVFLLSLLSYSILPFIIFIIYKNLHLALYLLFYYQKRKSRMKKALIILIVSLLVFEACSPVRSGQYAGKKRPKKYKTNGNTSGSGGFADEADYASDSGNRGVAGNNSGFSGEGRSGANSGNSGDSDKYGNDYNNQNGKFGEYSSGFDANGNPLSDSARFALMQIAEKINEVGLLREDTLVIYLDPVLPPQSYFEKMAESNNPNFALAEIYTDSEFNKAVKDFDAEKYEQACNQFQFWTETLMPGDSLHSEARFYLAECLIADNDIKNAEKRLLELYADKKVMGATKQKVIVRLGQVNCVLRKGDLAKKYFDELKKKYPKSIYIAIADCAYIR